MKETAGRKERRGRGEGERIRVRDRWKERVEGRREGGEGKRRREGPI